MICLDRAWTGGNPRVESSRPHKWVYRLQIESNWIKLTWTRSCIKKIIRVVHSRRGSFTDCSFICGTSCIYIKSRSFVIVDGVLIGSREVWDGKVGTRWGVRCCYGSGLNELGSERKKKGGSGAQKTMRNEGWGTNTLPTQMWETRREQNGHLLVPRYVCISGGCLEIFQKCPFRSCVYIAERWWFSKPTRSYHSPGILDPIRPILNPLCRFKSKGHFHVVTKNKYFYISIHGIIWGHGVPNHFWRSFEKISIIEGDTSIYSIFDSCHHV